MSASMDAAPVLQWTNAPPPRPPQCRRQATRRGHSEGFVVVHSHRKGVPPQVAGAGERRQRMRTAGRTAENRGACEARHAG